MTVNRPRILFVDDSPYVVEGIARMLHDRRGDWDIQYADSGETALALFAKTPFDIVATDLQMPGMNGDTLIKRIRGQCPRTRYIVLCGDAEAPDAEAIARQGYPVIEKPCDGNEIQAVVEAEIQLLRTSTT